MSAVGDCYRLTWPDGRHRAYARVAANPPGRPLLHVFGLPARFAGEDYQAISVYERELAETARRIEDYEFEEARARAWTAPDHEWGIGDHFVVDSRSELVSYGEILDHLAAAPSLYDNYWRPNAREREQWLDRFHPRTPHRWLVRIHTTDDSAGRVVEDSDRDWTFVSAEAFKKARGRKWRPERHGPKDLLEAEAILLQSLSLAEWHTDKWRRYAATFDELLRRSGLINVDRYRAYVTGRELGGDKFIEALERHGLPAALKSVGLETPKRSRRSVKGAV